MRILCVGANHRSADVAVRERLAFDAERRARALGELAARWADAEFVILSTCNRSEVYTARPAHGHPRAEEFRRWLEAFGGLDAERDADVLYQLSDGEAVGHLFAVAAGLDSLVPGEAQIVSQVKEAYAAAVEAGTARAVMNELFQTSFHVAKHIRTETNIATGKVSVASVAVEFVSQLFETLAGKCVLNIGAGEMNQIMLRHLAGRGAGRILVTNRTADRAAALAEEFDAEARPFETLAEQLAEADIVVTSTGSPEPILPAEMVRDAQRRRGFRPLLIVDIAVPRDVAPDAGEVDNVFLYNIDDLEGIVQANLAQRHGERGPARSIIEEHVGELLSSLNVRAVQPVIHALYRRMDEIARQELTEAHNKFSTHADSDEDMQILQRAVRRVLRRMLHPAAQKLRQSAGSETAAAHAAALRELFDLDEPEGPAPDGG